MINEVEEGKGIDKQAMLMSDFCSKDREPFAHFVESNGTFDLGTHEFEASISSPISTFKYCFFMLLYTMALRDAVFLLSLLFLLFF